MTNTADTTRYFAAYDADSIYAVGRSEDEALNEAAELCHVGCYRFETAEISEAMFNQIERQGWDGRNQSFEIRNGELIETTGE